MTPDQLQKYYQETVNLLESYLSALDNELPPIVITERGPRYIQRSDILACHLKARRLVSLLNASLILLQEGYPQEVYILGRAIDETAEDIAFMSLDNPVYKEKQKQFIEDFFMEEWEDPDDPLSTAARPYLKRRSIRAAISNITINAGDPSTINKHGKAIYSLFSGFVHGAYVHLLEFITPEKLKFPMSGMKGSQYMNVCKNNLANHIYRAILPCVIVAARLKRDDVKKKLISLAEDFSKNTKAI